MQNLNTIRHKLSAEITSVPAYLQSKNYPALTGIRGLAIVLVLLYHLGINHFLRRFDGWLFGRTGVDIFFVLSGFLITTLLIKEKIDSGNISLKRFYARRALRIIPVAYLFLVVMIVINYFFKLNIISKSFIYGFLFLKNLPVSGINDHWTTHLWSVSIEVQFYLFYPLLLFVNINKTAVLAAIGVIGILLFSWLGFNQVGIFHNDASLYRLCRIMMDAFWEGPFAILIGSLFSILAVKGIINGQVKNGGLLCFLLLIVAIVVRSKTFLLYTPYLSEFLFDILIGIVIVFSVGSVNLFTRLMNTRFLAWMGILSYSIYIWQQIFVWMPIYWVTTDTLFIVSDLVRLAAMIGTACLSYYFFEKRFLGLKSHYAMAEPRVKSQASR